MNMSEQSGVHAVAAIVASFNTRDFTRSALLSLRKSEYPLSQIIVIDNASTDGSIEMIAQEFKEVRLIKNQTNVGFARACNQGIELCATETYIWLVNSDAEVHPQTLTTLVAYLDHHRRVGMLGPLLLYPGGSLQSSGGFFPSFSNVLRYLVPIASLFPKALRRNFRDMALYPQSIPEDGLSVDYATGAACLLRREALNDAGLLAEEYFMYFEETDLAWRMHQKQWEVRIIPTPPVVHVYGGSYKRKHDPKRLQIFLKSLSLFVQKNYHGVRRLSILFLIRILGPFSVALKTTFRC
jgi:GT2 family glycosyltransferase